MNGLFAALSIMQRDQRQGAGLFVVGSDVDFVVNPGMPSAMDFFHSDTGKVAPNRRFP